MNGSSCHTCEQVMCNIWIIYMSHMRTTLPRSSSICPHTACTSVCRYVCMFVCVCVWVRVCVWTQERERIVEGKRTDTTTPVCACVRERESNKWCRQRKYVKLKRICVTWLIRMWHDLFAFDVTHSCLTLEQQVVQIAEQRADDTFTNMCDMAYSHGTWLIRMWHDSFIFDVTHLCLALEQQVVQIAEQRAYIKFTNMGLSSSPLDGIYLILIYIHIYIHISYMNTYIHTHTPLYIHIYIRISYVNTYSHTHTHTHTHVYTCVYVHICALYVHEFGLFIVSTRRYTLYTGIYPHIGMVCVYTHAPFLFFTRLRTLSSFFFDLSPPWMFIVPLLHALSLPFSLSYSNTHTLSQPHTHSLKPT